MRALVQECWRYFEPPYCSRRVCDSAPHTARCWDDEYHFLSDRLGDAESDNRALQAQIQSLQNQARDLRAQISIIKGEKTRSVRGPSPQFWEFDEVKDWGAIVTEGGVRDVLDAYARPGRVSKPKPPPVQEEDDVREVVNPHGVPLFLTKDGKRFSDKRSAMRHAVLLRHGRGYGS